MYDVAVPLGPFGGTQELLPCGLLGGDLVDRRALVIDARQLIRRWSSGSVRQNPDARARQWALREHLGS